MSVSDFRKSSAQLLIGTATNSLAIGGLTISSNSSPGSGWVLVTTGSNSAIWRDGIAFGSNATDVSSVAAGGSSSSNSRADHVHRGVRSISHASNTFYGNVVYTTPGDSVGITSPTAGTFAFTATSTGTGGSGNTIASGTAFPGGPADNQLFYRNDRDILYYYDGTLTMWLSVELKEHTIGNWTNVAASTPQYSAPPNNLYNCYIVDFVTTLFAGSGLTGSAYWRVDLYFYDGATIGSVIATVNNQSGTNNSFARTTASVNALLGTGTDAILSDLIKVSTPGNFYGGALVTYRLVG